MRMEGTYRPVDGSGSAERDLCLCIGGLVHLRLLHLLRRVTLGAQHARCELLGGYVGEFGDAVSGGGVASVAFVGELKIGKEDCEARTLFVGVLIIALESLLEILFYCYNQWETLECEHTRW